MKENEEITNLERFELLIEDCKGHRELYGEFSVGEYDIEIMQHIISEYKRVLKENEELKQEKINNYKMIALAQNEALGYMQGYEDGKKLKRSAVANIVENQQYYIIKKQIEKYETYIEQLRKELGQKDKIIDLMSEQLTTPIHDKEWVKQYFENKAKERR
nr:MAG TPA_asm: hypothetical protein [Bacteriophage sp.]